MILSSCSLINGENYENMCFGLNWECGSERMGVMGRTRQVYYKTGN